MSPMNNRLLVPRKVPGLLDLVPGAAAAYSLRSLSRSYADPVVTVRRSSDDAEEDFTAAEVSDGTLAAFAGAGDGFVKQWWDQSGNANHAVAAADTNEPKIVDSGVVVTEEGKPALQFDGSNDYFSVTASIAEPAFVFVGSMDDVTSAASFFDSPPGPGRAFLHWRGNLSPDQITLGNLIGPTVILRYINDGTFENASQFVLIGDINNTASQIRKDGASLVEGDAGSGSLVNYYIGGEQSLSSFYAYGGKMQEVLFWPGDVSGFYELIEGQIAWSFSQ